MRQHATLCGGHATTADVSPTNELSLSLCLLCALSLSCVCVCARALSLSLSCALSLALADVSPTKDAEEREKALGTEPTVFTERFHPLAKYASIKQWREEAQPHGEWALDDVDALEQPAGNASNPYGGRSAAEQRLIYGEDPFNLGHPVDSDSDNGWPLGDQRLKGPGDGAPMPAFPRDTLGPHRPPARLVLTLFLFLF